jgi:hypothetical protein
MGAGASGRRRKGCCAAALEGKKDFGDGDDNRAIQSAVRVSRTIGAA